MTPSMNCTHANQAVARIKSMRLRPGMWAFTYEAFALQVALLLEFAGLDRNQVNTWLRQNVKLNDLTNEITDNEAGVLCETALQRLAEEWRVVK